MTNKDTDVLIIDGYNVLYAWYGFNLPQTDLEYAREQLIASLTEYGAYQGLRIVIVFDAHGVAGTASSSRPGERMEVVYTGEGETADSYIEKLVYRLVRHGEKAYVVTSDAMEQMIILGSGGYRISARELELRVRQAKREIEESVKRSALREARHEIGSRVNEQVAARLDKLRRRR